MSQTRALVRSNSNKLILDALQDSGIPFSTTDSNAILIVEDPSFKINNANQKKDSQWEVTNKINGISVLYTGTLFSRLYQKFSRIIPEKFNFMPPTYILPYQNIEVMKKIKKNGRNLFIYTTDPKNNEPGTVHLSPADYMVMSDQPAIGQKRIDSVIIDCQEIKISVFVLIASVVPLVIFTYKEGIVHYFDNENGKYEDKFNKNSNFQSLSEFLQRLEDEFNIKTKKSWKTINEIIILSMALVHPYIKEYNAESYPYSHNFQLLQYDFLIDSSWKFYLHKISPIITTDHNDIQEYLIKVNFVRDSFLGAIPINEIQQISDARRYWWTNLSDMSSQVSREFFNSNPIIDENLKKHFSSEKKYANFMMAFPCKNAKEEYVPIIDRIYATPRELFKQ